MKRAWPKPGPSHRPFPCSYRDITAEVLSRIKLPEGVIQSTVNNCKSTRVVHNFTLGTRINRDRPHISKRSFIRTDRLADPTRTAAVLP